MFCANVGLASMWVEEFLLELSWERLSRRSRSTSVIPILDRTSRNCAFSSLRIWFCDFRSLFSSFTVFAIVCISIVAFIFSDSYCRFLASSSWTYSFRRSRDRLWFSRMRARLADFCPSCYHEIPVLAWVKYNCVRELKDRCRSFSTLWSKWFFLPWNVALHPLNQVRKIRMTRPKCLVLVYNLRAAKL